MAEGITDLDMNSFDETIGSSDTPDRKSVV